MRSFTGDTELATFNNGLGVQIYAQALLNSWLAAEIGYFNSGGFERDMPAIYARIIRSIVRDNPPILASLSE